MTLSLPVRRSNCSRDSDCGVLAWPVAIGTSSSSATEDDMGGVEEVGNELRPEWNNTELGLSSSEASSVLRVDAVHGEVA